MYKSYNELAGLLGLAGYLYFISDFQTQKMYQPQVFGLQNETRSLWLVFKNCRNHHVYFVLESNGLFFSAPSKMKVSFRNPNILY